MEKLNYLLDACFIRDIVEKDRRGKVKLNLFFSDVDGKARFYVSSWTISELMNVEKAEREAIWKFLRSAGAGIVFFGDNVEKHEEVTFKKLLQKPNSYFKQNRASFFEMEKVQKTESLFRICILIGSIVAWLIKTKEEARTLKQFSFSIHSFEKLHNDKDQLVRNWLEGTLHGTVSRKDDKEYFRKIIAEAMSLALFASYAAESKESNWEKRYYDLVDKMNALPSEEKTYTGFLKDVCFKFSATPKEVFSFIQKEIAISSVEYSPQLLELMLVEKLFENDRFPRMNDISDFGLISLVESCLHKTNGSTKMLILTSDVTLVHFIEMLSSLPLMKESRQAIGRYVVGFGNS
jgi:hypothetical protein